MKNFLYYSFLSGMALLALSGETQALTCTAAPSCADLGYTKTSCSGGGGVKCPFDSSKMFCIREGGGADYKFNNAISRYQIAFSDGTTGKYYNEDKVAIGIITHLHNYGDRKHGIMVSLQPFAIQTIEQARKMCAAYTTAGTMAGDWRLPSLAELSTMMRGYDKDKTDDYAMFRAAFASIPTAGDLEMSFSSFYSMNQFKNGVDEFNSTNSGPSLTKHTFPHSSKTTGWTGVPIYMADALTGTNVFYSQLNSVGHIATIAKTKKMLFRCVAEF